MNPRIGATDSSVASEVYQYHRLDPELVEQLVSIYRVMFPHDSIPDEFYEHVVQKLDEKAEQNQDFTCFLSEGVEALNAPTSSFWFDLPVEGKLAALKRSEQTPFFQALRSDFVNFFYSNPAIWPRFGYQGPSNEQGGYLHRGFNDIDWIKSEELYDMLRTFDLDDGSVVLIIGSGAGGGTLGNELAQKKIRTLILEAGPRIEYQQHIDNESQSFAQLTWLDKRTTSGSCEVARNYPNFPAWTCKVVGGTTVHWAGCSLRFQEHEFQTKDVYGDIPGASLLNWPLTLAELEPYYDKAEDKMGVTGTHGIPLLDANNNQMVMAAGAKKVGYKEYSTGNMAINSRPRDGRPGTIQDGFCYQGIRSNAKWSTLNAEIPKGEATGHLEVRPQCHVLRIEHDKSGEVTGVVYADKQGNHHRQRARIVCVAGNSIETARILLIRQAPNIRTD